MLPGFHDVVVSPTVPPLTIVAIVAETALGAYAAFVVWLLSVWMVDDSAAVGMTGADWYIEAGRRVLVSVVVAGVFTIAVQAVNRRWLAGFGESRVLRRLAPALGVGIALAGIAGSIDFVIRRPFM